MQHEIGNLPRSRSAGQQIPLSELATLKESTGASFIYRENNSRYVGIQFSIEGRNLEGIVKSGQQAIAKKVNLPQGYRLDWGGEYSELLDAKAQPYIIGPLAILPDFPDSSLLFMATSNSDHDRTRSCPHRTGRRADCAEADTHAAQRFQRAWTARASWGLC